MPGITTEAMHDICCPGLGLGDTSKKIHVYFEFLNGIELCKRKLFLLASQIYN